MSCALTPAISPGTLSAQHSPHLLHLLPQQLLWRGSPACLGTWLGRPWSVLGEHLLAGCASTQGSQSPASSGALWSPKCWPGSDSWEVSRTGQSCWLAICCDPPGSAQRAPPRAQQRQSSPAQCSPPRAVVYFFYSCTESGLQGLLSISYSCGV